MPRSLIVSSRHLESDARLERWKNLLSTLSEVEATFLTSVRSKRYRRLTFWTSSLRKIKNSDLILLPDPDLHVIYPLLKLVFRSKVFVLDVHEDYRATNHVRKNRLKGLRNLAISSCQVSYRRASRSRDLIVVADRVIEVDNAFLLSNGSVGPPVESVRVPQSIAYIGDFTLQRGARELVRLAKELPDFSFVVVGRIALQNGELQELSDLPNLKLLGPLSLEESLAATSECAFGLSMLQDYEAYAGVVPTKLFDYCRAGMIPIVTPLPEQARFVRENEIGFVCSSFELREGSLSELRRFLVGISDAELESKRKRMLSIYEKRKFQIIEQWSQICLEIEGRLTVERSEPTKSKKKLL